MSGTDLSMAAKLAAPVRVAIAACAIGVALGATAAARGAEAPPAIRMIDAAIAGDQARLERALLQLKSQEKPPRGDRRLARDLNERGLAFWQRQRYAEAANVFRQAHIADASDAEIVENLGYALLKSGEVTSAEQAIIEALTLGPDRASAWGSLGLIYAKQGKHREGVACVVTAYRFASDKKRALDVYSRLARTDEDPKVRAVLSDVVSRVAGARAEADRG